LVERQDVSGYDRIDRVEIGVRIDENDSGSVAPGAGRQSRPLENHRLSGDEHRSQLTRSENRPRGELGVVEVGFAVRLDSLERKDRGPLGPDATWPPSVTLSKIVLRIDLGAPADRAFR